MSQILNNTVLAEEDYYILYEGGKKFYENCARYLWRSPLDSDPENLNRYAKRKLISPYKNYQKKIVNTFKSYVFYNPPKPSGNEYDAVAIASKLLTHSAIGGYAYLVTLDSGPAVYPLLYVSEKADGVFEIKTPKNENDIISYNSNTGTLIAKVNGKEFTTNAPNCFQKVYWDDSCTSLIADTSVLGVTIYNLTSVLIGISLSLQHITPYGPAGAVENGKMTISQVYIPVNAQEVAPGFAQPSAAAMTELQKLIDRYTLEMGEMVGLGNEFAREVKVQSGISMAMDSIDTSALVGSMARNISAAMRNAAEAYKAITGKDGVTLEFDPLLDPTAKDRKMQNYSILLSSVKVDEVIKAVQEELTKSLLPDREDLMQLLQAIKTKGGMKSIDISILEQE